MRFCFGYVNSEFISVQNDRLRHIEALAEISYLLYFRFFSRFCKTPSE